MLLPVGELYPFEGKYAKDSQNIKKMSAKSNLFLFFDILAVFYFILLVFRGDQLVISQNLIVTKIIHFAMIYLII